MKSERGYQPKGNGAIPKPPIGGSNAKAVDWGNWDNQMVGTIVTISQADFDMYTQQDLREHCEQLADMKAQHEKVMSEFAEQCKMAYYYEFEEVIPSVMADKIDELLKEYLEKLK